MKYQNSIIFEGVVIKDPTTVPAGKGSILKLTVGHTFFRKNNNHDKTYLDVDCWMDTTEFSGEEIGKFSVVEVKGRLKQDHWKTKDGQSRSSYTIVASSVECKGKQEWKPEDEEALSDEEFEKIPF